MGDINSSLGKPEDGTGLFNRAVLGQMAGVLKTLSRAEFDSLVAAERLRIQNNSIGVYLNDECLGMIQGEIGARYWFLATGGTDLQNSEASHGKTVEIAGRRTILDQDGSTYRATTGAPSTPANNIGSKRWDAATNLVYTWNGSWSAGVPYSSIGGMPTQVAFSTTIPLDGVKLMPKTAITGPLTLTTGAKTPGGQCRTPFVSNGVNTPVIVGATEAESSYGFDIATVGRLQTLDEWTDDGIDAWYQWTRGPVGGQVTVPTLMGMTVNGTAVVLTYSSNLNTAAPAASAYSIIGAGGVTQAPTAVAISGANVNLTLATPAVAGNTVTGTYTVPGTNPIRDTAGTAAAAFTAQSIVNNTSAGPTAPAITSDPVILGTPTEGTASAFTAGPVTGNPTPTNSQEWLVDDVAAATTASYTPPTGSAGKTLKVRQTANNGVGSPASRTSSGIIILVPGVDDYQTWLSNLAAASGDASTTEKNAAQNFIDALKSGSTATWNNVARANILANDPNGGLVPVRRLNGLNDQATGTQNNAGGRTLVSTTGFINTRTKVPAILGGLSCYLRDIQPTTPAQARVFLGCRNASTQAFRIAGNLTGEGVSQALAVQGLYGGPGTGQPGGTITNAQWVGHWHVHRSSAQSIKLRRNNALIGTEITTSVTVEIPDEEIYVMCHNAAGTPSTQLVNPSSMGYYAILQGAMTDAQATAYNAAVVALMTAMGRNL